MKPYTYILIEFFTVVVCFLFSFDRRIQFHKQFGSFFKAGLVVAIPFIIWDIWFTEMKVWWFDFDYTLGIRLYGLPLEEWLFFICIPFSCIFTFFYIENLLKLDFFFRYSSLTSLLIIIVCSIAGIIFMDKIYTLLTCLVTVMAIVYLQFIARVDWMLKALLLFLFLMPGFLSVNGILTGSLIDSPIVNYNENEIIGFRIFTIPIEDSFYGFTQFVLVWYFFQYFSKRSTVKLPNKERAV